MPSEEDEQKKPNRVTKNEHTMSKGVGDRHAKSRRNLEDDPTSPNFLEDTLRVAPELSHAIEVARLVHDQASPRPGPVRTIGEAMQHGLSA